MPISIEEPSLSLLFIPVTLMASSKLFHTSSSLLRFRRSINSLSSSHHFLPSRGSPVPRFHRLHFFFAASTAAFEGTETAAAATHPWPEWDQFFDRIRSKGYFESLDDDEELFPAAFGNKGAAVNNVCFKFARERFDIYRLLPKEAIRSVECGYRNLFRKAVNSAKRLRAFLRLDEGEGCNSCNIPGSCDRAYIAVYEEEGARTVDLIRILLSYAVNPAALLGEENMPVKVLIQESARKLLSEVINLRDTTIDPSLPKPIMTFSSQEDSSSQLKTTISSNKDLQNAMKRGDWLCPICNFLNFARNARCLQCKADGPKRVDSNAVEMKPGDWTCPECNFMNFARNRKCFRCLEQRPKRDLNPGDWECPKCDFLNFSRNQVCRKCNYDHPNNENTEARDHVWRKLENTTNIKKSKFGDSEDDDIIKSEDEILSDEEDEDKSSPQRKLSSAPNRDTSS